MSFSLQGTGILLKNHRLKDQVAMSTGQGLQAERHECVQTIKEIRAPTEGPQTITNSLPLA